MLFELVLVIPSLLHLATGQTATPDPLEELFGRGLDQKVDSWSTNLLFGDANFNEISNSLVSTPPPLQRNNRRGNSQRESLPMGLSFLNGGDALPGLFGQETNPSSIDTTSTGENELFNIPPMPNFDQLGLNNVLDKFLPIDGSVRLPPPSNDPIVHSRDNVPIPSIGQLGLDSNGLFGQSLFSPNAGSLSSKPTSPSRLADPAPTPRANNNINNINRNTNIGNNLNPMNQIKPTNVPSVSFPTVQTESAQTPSVSGRSEQQKLLDQQIWDSIIPPLPENRKPVEVFPQNNPTPKPKVNQKNPKKKKALLPLLPPSPSRKTSGQSRLNSLENANKNKDSFSITSDNLLKNIPSIDQLIFGTDSNLVATTKSPPKINNDNLIENIPSIDELGFDLLGGNLPLLDKGTEQDRVVTPKPPRTVDNTFQLLPDRFSEGTGQISPGGKDQTFSAIETPENKDLKADTDNSTTSLETLWNILIETVPGLPGIISGEEVTTPKPKGSYIESILGISASDIDKFNNETQSKDTKTVPTAGIPVSILPDILPPNETPKVIQPSTTLPPVVYIQTSTTQAPPLTVYSVPPTKQSPTTPKAAVYNPSDFLNVETYIPTTKPTQPPDIHVPPPTVVTIDFSTKNTDNDLSKPTGGKLQTDNTPPPFDFNSLFLPTESINFSTKNTDNDLSKPTGGELQTDNTPPPFDFNSLFLPTESNPNSQKTESKQNTDTANWQPEIPFEENPFLFNLPTIPEEQFNKPNFEDLGIIKNEPDLLPEIPLLTTSDRIVGTNDQAPKRQSQTFEFDFSLGDKQTNLFDKLPNIFEEPRVENNINKMSNELKSKTDTQKDFGVDSNSPNKNLETKMEEELSLPGLDSLLGQTDNELTQKTLKVTTTPPPTTTVPEIPILDLSMLGGFNADIMNQEQGVNKAKEEQMKIDIQHTSFKDVPPLDFDIFKDTVKTTPPPILSLPSLPSLGNLNSAVHNGQESVGGDNFEIMNNVDPLKRIIDSGPTLPPNSENSVPISNSLRQNGELFPFVAPTSEASKHFIFQDQLNGGNMRTHPVLTFTTPKPPVKSKPNIIVIDIQKRPPEKQVPDQRQSNPSMLQNTENIASIQSDTNSKNIVRLHQGSRSQQINNPNLRNLQQVTPAPSRVTTPAWLSSTILAIRERLNQLRALRNRQNNGNNNAQNQASNVAQNQNRNIGLNSNLPPNNNAVNNQRSNIQQIQIQLRNRLLQNGNLRNSNNQQAGRSGVLPLANLNFRGLPQNQVSQQRNFQLHGRTPFQIPNVPNQFNQPNVPQFRQTGNIPSQNQQQLSTAIQGSQSRDGTQNDLELVRERIRQRIQQILRTQLLRHLLARRLQTLQNQTPNSAPQPQQPQQPQNQNQPVWRPPSTNNNMNVMNTNNAINLIRQARQRTLMASQQQRQQQQQQNQPNIDLSRNIFERFGNFQNPGFVPNQFRPPQPQQGFDFSRLVQNNGRPNFNNRFGQPFQQLISNGTNGGNGNNREQQLDLSRPPSELALQNLRNFNLQRTGGVQQGTTSNFRTNQNLVVQRRALPVSEAFQLIERLRAQNRDIAPFGNFNSNNIPNSLVERFRNGLLRFQPVQNVPQTVFNRQRIVVPINGPLLGQRNNQNITRRPNLGQTSAPPRFTGPPGGWNWGAQQNSDK